MLLLVIMPCMVMVRIVKCSAIRHQNTECRMLNTLNTSLLHSQGTLLLLYTILAERSCYLCLNAPMYISRAKIQMLHWLMFGLFIDCSLGQAAKHEPSTLTFRLQTADSGVTTARILSVYCEGAWRRPRRRGGSLIRLSSDANTS